MSYYFEPAIEQARQQTKSLLTDFIDTPTVDSDLLLAFGNTFNNDEAFLFLQEWVEGDIGILPPIEVLSAAELNYARGAYSSENNTIYLSDEFLARSQNSDVVTSVLIEELGHFLDDEFNISDAPGDEGDLFSRLVRDELDEATLNLIQQEDDSDYIIVNDEYLAVEQANYGVNPAFDLIGLTELRNDSRFSDIDGTGFSVAVIDTGINYFHPDLAPNYLIGDDNYLIGDDFVSRDGDPFDEDPDSHGTHVSGTVGASNEIIGVATDVKLIGLRVLNNYGGSPFSQFNILEGLEWVRDNHDEHGITAVNISIGNRSALTSPDQIISDDPFVPQQREIIEELEAEGVTVVSAAGNNYDNNPVQGVDSPGIFSTIVAGAVSATDTIVYDGTDTIVYETDDIANFSQRLDPDYHPGMLFAPGVDIFSTVAGGQYDILPGTSMASPHIAGAVALLQEASVKFSDRTLSPEEVRDILVSTAEDIYDGNTEYPRLNVYNAVEEVWSRSLEAEPEPEPEPEPTPEPEPGEDSLDTDIFRFQNDAVPGTYIYVGESEAQNIRENFDNFSEEGKAFQVAVEPGDDLMPMYRFQSETTPGTYLFVGEQEKDNINSNFAESFSEEGIAFYTYDVESNLGTDFYRFGNTAQPGTYLFATGEERENIRDNFPNFDEEGIAFSVDV